MKKIIVPGFFVIMLLLAIIIGLSVAANKIGSEAIRIIKQDNTLNTTEAIKLMGEEYNDNNTYSKYYETRKTYKQTSFITWSIKRDTLNSKILTHYPNKN